MDWTKVWWNNKQWRISISMKNIFFLKTLTFDASRCVHHCIAHFFRLEISDFQKQKKMIHDPLPHQSDFLILFSFSRLRRIIVVGFKNIIVMGSCRLRKPHELDSLIFSSGILWKFWKMKFNANLTRLLLFDISSNPFRMKTCFHALIRFLSHIILYL